VTKISGGDWTTGGCVLVIVALAAALLAPIGVAIAVLR